MNNKKLWWQELRDFGDDINVIVQTFNCPEGRFARFFIKYTDTPWTSVYIPYRDKGARIYTLNFETEAAKWKL